MSARWDHCFQSLTFLCENLEGLGTRLASDPNIWCMEAVCHKQAEVNFPLSLSLSLSLLLSCTCAHTQWPSTSRSIFDQEKAASVVVDLMYKVHTTHPELLMLCCQLLQHHNSCSTMVSKIPILTAWVRLEKCPEIMSALCSKSWLKTWLFCLITGVFPSRVMCEEVSSHKGSVQRKVKQTSSTTNKQQRALCKELQESLKQK